MLRLIAIYAMEIIAKIEDANPRKFGSMNGLFVEGETLKVKTVQVSGLKLDNGEVAKHNVVVITFDGSDKLVYPTSQIKNRYTFKNEIVGYTHALHNLVAAEVGKTLEEAAADLKEALKGKSLMAVPIHYKGVDKNGDCRDFTFFEFDIK